MSSQKKCDLGKLSGHLKDISLHCCAGHKDCEATGLPGAKSKCSEQCAKEVEPFWDSCSEILRALHMVPDGFDKFYDKCMAVL